MPLFEITPDIQKNAEPLTPGWYPLEVTKIEDKVSDEKHTTTFTVKVIEGPRNGTIFWNSVNHDPNYMHYSLEWIKFQLGNRRLDKTKTEKVNMDVNNVAHKQFMGYVTNRKDDQGRVMNQLQRFKPISEKAKILAAEKGEKVTA